MILFQTYTDKQRIPQKVFDNVREFAGNYEHRVTYRFGYFSYT